MTWLEVEKKTAGISRLFLPEQAHVLFDEAQKLPDGATILEIGAFKGYTTCVLALACIGTIRKVYTIDTFTGNLYNTNLQDGESYYEEFQANLEHCGVNEIVRVLKGRSEEFYGTFDKPLDLLFIDGNHELPIVQADIQAFLHLLKSGCTLLMHDVWPSDYAPENPRWFDMPMPLKDCRGLQNLMWGTKL